MSVEERNKDLARKWFEVGWGKGDVSIAEEVFSPHFVLRGRVVGPDGPKRSVRARRSAFAEMSVRIEHLLAERDQVVTHFSTEARHVGEFRGFAPTGALVRAAGIVIWTVTDGLVVEDRNCFDTAAVTSAIQAATIG